MAGSGPPLHKTYDEEIGSIRPGEAGQLLLAWRRLLRLLGISGFNPGDEPSPVPQLNVVTVGQSFARTSKMAVSGIAKFENVLETDFAKRRAKREGAFDANWRARSDSNSRPPDS